MERTGKDAYEEVLRSTHDIPFNLGPFGEQFSYSNTCFLRSAAGLEAVVGADAVEGPAPGESFIEAAWICPKKNGGNYDHSCPDCAALRWIGTSR